MIYLATIGIIAAVLIPRWIPDFHKGGACVDRLARGGEGACPVTGQAYAPGEYAVCSADHLPSSPRFPRTGGPPSQTLPAAEASSAIDLQPSFAWRWIGAPLLQIVGTLLVGGSLMAARRGDVRLIALPLLTAAAGMVAMVATVTSAWGSERIEGAKGRVVHRRWMAGVELAPRVYEGATAVVPVKPREGAIRAVLVHGRQATPLAYMRMEDVARLDAQLR